MQDKPTVKQLIQSSMNQLFLKVIQNKRSKLFRPDERFGKT